MNYSKYNLGDIFVAKNPFSDLSGSKIRPVVIISPNSYNQKYNDVVTLKITSVRREDLFSFPITNLNLIEDKLKVNSFIRLDKPFSLSKEILGKKITSLKAKYIIKLRQAIIKFYDLS